MLKRFSFVMLNQNTYRLKRYKSSILKAKQNIILLSMFLQIWIQPFNSHLECFMRQDWWTFRSAGSVAIMKVVLLGAPQTATSSWHRPGHKQWDNWNTELQLQSHTLPLPCSYLTNEVQVYNERYWGGNGTVTKQFNWIFYKPRSLILSSTVQYNSIRW